MLGEPLVLTDWGLCDGEVDKDESNRWFAERVSIKTEEWMVVKTFGLEVNHVAIRHAFSKQLLSELHLPERISLLCKYEANHSIPRNETGFFLSLILPNSIMNCLRK